MFIVFLKRILHSSIRAGAQDAYRTIGMCTYILLYTKLYRARDHYATKWNFERCTHNTRSLSSITIFPRVFFICTVDYIRSTWCARRLHFIMQFAGILTNITRAVLLSRVVGTRWVLFIYDNIIVVYNKTKCITIISCRVGHKIYSTPHGFICIHIARERYICSGLVRTISFIILCIALNNNNNNIYIQRIPRVVHTV